MADCADRLLLLSETACKGHLLTENNLTVKVKDTGRFLCKHPMYLLILLANKLTFQSCYFWLIEKSNLLFRISDP